MIDWCNEQGGINGRQIVGNYYDAAITNVVNVTTEACSQVFMLVGEAGRERRQPGGDPAGLRPAGGADLRGEPRVRQRRWRTSPCPTRPTCSPPAALARSPSCTPTR